MWVASYPHGLQRLNIKQDDGTVVRSRKRLPSPGWFLASLRNVDERGRNLSEQLENHAIDWDRTNVRVRHAIEIIGLVEVKAGHVLADIMTSRCQEEELMFKYLASCADCCSLSVVQGAWFKQPVGIHTEAGGHAVTTRHDCFFMGPDISDHVFASDLTFEETLDQWGFPGEAIEDIPVILTVEPIVHLIRHGLWRHLYFRACRVFRKCDADHNMAGRFREIQNFRSLVIMGQACRGPAHLRSIE